jgi:DNA-binding NtrC family response regulator
MDERLRIMVVDDELIVRESLYHWFKKGGHTVEAVSSGIEALDILEKKPFEVLFVDMKMPRMNGLELLKRVKEAYPETIVILITAYGSIETSVEAMKLGASDYLLKPFKPDQLALVLEKITRERKLTSDYHYVRGLLEEITRFDNMIGQSPPMTAIFDLIPKVARSESSVLISGETGTGKELVAKAIHAGSFRSKGPFIAMNCGALPDALLESELFGHQKGAFTGANHARKGFIEVASGGTLFLDEIGEISPKMQVDLLRVLEEKKIIRIGDREPIDVDFRLLSSTRRVLDEEVAAGRFREDLLYRINVITLHIPPLRERKEDILPLVKHFLSKYSHETTKQVDRVAPEAIEFLKSYGWPGNVRELENAIERAVVLSKSRTLGVEDFSFIRPSPVQFRKGRSLKEMEKDYIQGILEEQGWNITESAKILGVNRVSLHKIINRYQLKRPGVSTE